MSGYNNPYAPVLDLQNPSVSNYPLASLGKRFLGFLVDGLLPMAAMIPGYGAMVLGSDFSEPEPELGPVSYLGMAWMFIVGLALFVVQVYLLVTRSQTIGKYVVKTQIMDVETNQPAGFVKAGLLRMFVSGLIGAIPCVGPIYTIVDCFFVFREDRRCVHDLIAGTQVVDIA